MVIIDYYLLSLINWIIVLCIQVVNFLYFLNKWKNECGKKKKNCKLIIH